MTQPKCVPRDQVAYEAGLTFALEVLARAHSLTDATGAIRVERANSEAWRLLSQGLTPEGLYHQDPG